MAQKVSGEKKGRLASLKNSEVLELNEWLSALTELYWVSSYKEHCNNPKAEQRHRYISSQEYPRDFMESTLARLALLS